MIKTGTSVLTLKSLSSIFLVIENTNAEEFSMAKKLACVELGSLAGYGDTKAEAKADLQKQINHLATHAAGGPRIETRNGAVLIAYAVASDFAYQVIWPEYLANPANHGKIVHGTCMFKAKDIYEAMDMARAHVCQYFWTREVTGDESFIDFYGVKSPERRDNLKRLFDHYRAQQVA
jgi:hypothetical protein